MNRSIPLQDPTAPADHPRTAFAILMMVLAATSFAFMGVLVKVATQELPFLVPVFFRSTVGALGLLLIFKLRGWSLRGIQQGLLFLRSLSGFAALLLFFFALKYLPLGIAVVLNFSSPVFVVLFGTLFLKEGKGRYLVPLVLVGFVGAALLVSPNFSQLNVTALLGLLSAVFAAIAYILVKRLSRTESPATIVLYFSAYSSLLATIAIVLAVATGMVGPGVDVIVDRTLRPHNLMALTGVGLCATLGQLFLTKAYSIERASVVTGFSYLNPVLSFVLGFSLFGEVPTVSGAVGATLVVGSCLAIALAARNGTPVQPPSD